MANSGQQNQQHGYERRAHLRIRTGAAITIRHGSFGTLIATTVDISDGGMQVRLEKPIKIPEGSHLQINMLNSANPDISFNMKVIRSSQDVLGMQFIDYEYDGQRHKLDELFLEMKSAKK